MFLRNANTVVGLLAFFGETASDFMSCIYMDIGCVSRCVALALPLRVLI